MTCYLIERRTRKYVKGYVFLSFGRNLSNKYRRQLFDAATKIELNTLRTTIRKVAHKAAEAIGELIGTKIANKTVKPKLAPHENSRNVEEIIIPPEQREEILNKLRQVL